MVARTAEGILIVDPDAAEEKVSLETWK